MTTSKGRSFENAIQSEIARTNGDLGSVDSDRKGVAELMGTKPGEQVTVRWPAPTPGNGTVIDVSYQADLTVRSEDALRKEIATARRCYGAASEGNLRRA